MTTPPTDSPRPECPWRRQCRAALLVALASDDPARAVIAKRSRCNEPQPDRCEIKQTYDEAQEQGAQ